ncbi:hypothetical protein [Halpernia sp. GG3]
MSLSLFFNCKKSEPNDLVLGKWKSTSDIFPLDYNYNKCKLSQNATIDFRSDNTLEFLDINCKFKENYKFSNDSLVLYNNHWKFTYGILRNKNNLILISQHKENGRIKIFNSQPEEEKKLMTNGHLIFLQKIK